MTLGDCLCGALRYEVDGPFNLMMNCHCSMCRKHHGSAFATFVGAPMSGFRWTCGATDVQTYASSEHGQRYFCGTCGSVAPTLAPQMELAVLPAGNLQGTLGIKPQAHMFVGSKASWYTISDSLPRYEEYPPEFGATAVERPQPPSKSGTVQGSCLCGDVAYEIEGAPQRMMNCYCSRCRRARSAAHATNLFYPLEQFLWVRGASQVADFKLPEARYFATAFCTRCGGELPRVSKERGIVVVPAGSLDEHPGIGATAHICVASKADWVDITDTAAPQFAQMPPAP